MASLMSECNEFRQAPKTIRTIEFMTDSVRRNVAILGSTGSVGVNAVEVCEALAGINITGLTGRSNLALLSKQALQFPNATIVAADSKLASQFPFPAGLNGRLRTGLAAIEDLAASDQVDTVVAAIVGIAGLAGTVAAVRQGKTVALANKESLVVAGSILMPLAEQSGATVLPVDSEHSALLQCLAGGRRSEVTRIVLTASGGPFRDWTVDQMRDVTPAQATSHPTWNMGQKISVDSATMMNKALEIIEAAWLFGFPASQIGVMIHPQSIVHAMVEFQDGAVLAHLGPPDMRLPIQYALTWPERVCGPARRMNWSEDCPLELYAPDESRFPALQLGYEVVRRGGTCGAVLNAANESAVAAFLNGRLGFTEIVPACSEVLSHHQHIEQPDLDDLIQADYLAREETEKWILNC